MSTEGVLASRGLADVHDRVRADRTSAGVAVACGWIMILILVAPFEARQPLLQLPWQAITTVELVLFAGLGAWVSAGIVGIRVLPRLTDVLPWALFVTVATISALAAPAGRGNAVHMSGRFALMAAIWAATAASARDEAARRRLVIAATASGVVVALLAITDFLGIRAVTTPLAFFRENIAVVGAQVRASGPLQYPTIASMFLEITFALGLGLLISAASTSRSIVLVLLLAAMAEAIVLTFTRSGLITMALSLSIVGFGEWRRSGVSRSTFALAVLGAAIVAGFLTSRSAEMLMLRLTTEGQGQWFSAVIDAPGMVVLDTREAVAVPITIINTGRATWDSNAAEPVRLSYHWIERDTDRVVAWEGYRTSFPAPVRPGDTVSIVAKVGSTGRPGRFRLMWDLEQQGRLWFSTEPDARLVFSDGTITGPVTTRGTSIGGPTRIPRAATRPGRLVLWRGAVKMLGAYPILGVGPDNFRLLYGSYAQVARADPRVHSNNMYIEVAAGTGLLGILAALWLAVRLAKHVAAAYVASRLGPAIVAACAAIAVHGLTDSFLSFTGTYILIAVTLGLASACAIDGGRDAHRI